MTRFHIHSAYYLIIHFEPSTPHFSLPQAPNCYVQELYPSVYGICFPGMVGGGKKAVTLILFLQTHREHLLSQHTYSPWMLRYGSLQKVLQEEALATDIATAITTIRHTTRFCYHRNSLVAAVVVVVLLEGGISNAPLSTARVTALGARPALTIVVTPLWERELTVHIWKLS
ncbi:hypothetical protein E2C01_017578 [Portunus trituberculatus]|uniref:Uncharacterized protein n=1 Tax=Portunus trituberculatus TaxID=210409 RepID=A0A5B7DTW2_PORTR|nr:hypothetical protein [Portunus trituberculatus]